MIYQPPLLQADWLEFTTMVQIQLCANLPYQIMAVALSSPSARYNSYYYREVIHGSIVSVHN